MKRILIAGAGSYIGLSFESWLARPEYTGLYEVHTIDMRGDGWKKADFSGYDVIFHVAGIAHADIGKVKGEQKKAYYQVNCTLAAETARKAKAQGVKQFIFMSSMLVYGDSGPVGIKRMITRDTKPSPSDFYGDSKWKAEQRLRSMENDDFHIAILRPPIIYGERCRGNYRILQKIARLFPVFPDFPNERSMLYIGNLCEFVRLLAESGRGGVYLPQNPEYVRTAELVRMIGAAHHKNIYLTHWLNWGVYLGSRLPGKPGRMLRKAFGSVVYQKELVFDNSYQRYQFESSVRKTERIT